MPPLQVVLTGSTGYVGSAVAGALESKGHTPQPLLNEQRRPWRLGEAPLESQLAEADALIHLAWDRKARAADERWALNVNGSISLLRSAERAGVDRLVFVSSMAAQVERTRSSYAVEKRAVEQAFVASRGLVARPGLVWGDKPGGVLESLASLVGKTPVVPVPGGRRLAFLMVNDEDLARCIVSLVADDARFDALRGEIVEIAHPEPVLFSQIAAMLRGRGRGRRTMTVPVPRFVASLGVSVAHAAKLTALTADNLQGLLVSNQVKLLAPAPCNELRPFPVDVLAPRG